MKYKCLESLGGESRGGSDKAQTSSRIGSYGKVQALTGIQSY